MKKQIPLLMIALAVVLLAAGVLPGDLSPARVLKAIADRLVADGDFETLTPAFYNRIRPAFLGAGFAFLLIGGIAWWAGKTGSRALIRLAAGLLICIMLAGVAALVSLLSAGIQSPVFRALAGPPTATATPTPAFDPDTGVLVTATPSPVPQGPGTWLPIDFEGKQPTVLTHANDGSGRLFVGVRTGKIYIIADGAVLGTPFLDLSDRSIQEFTSIEQGLLGLAFHPDYAENGYFYVFYTDRNQNSVVSRFSVSAQDPNLADPDSEYRLFGIIKPAGDHNGGQLAFGPDGYLYIGTGDGGIQGDPFGYAQSLDTLMGKILRIDVDGGTPYGIPPDNPFTGRAGMDEIWAYGLRNPWRFSFDPLTGDLFIGDVGHNHFEEINYLPAGHPAGANFGWNGFEGMAYYLGLEPTAAPEAYRPPLWTYPHEGGVCAVVGGVVYRGSAFQDLNGVYLYADHCLGTIWGLQPGPSEGWTNSLLFDLPFKIASFGIDEAGEIYILGFESEILRLVP